MARLYLIRHGVTDDNLRYLLSGWTDTPLNEVGIQQAKVTAERLEQLARTDRRPDAVYASPLLRAAKTAEIIANRLGIPLIRKDDLKEMNFGLFDGQSIIRLYETHRDMVDTALNPGDDEFGWEGGETRQEVFCRIESAIRAIAENHLGRTVAVVTHAGAIAYFLAGILGEPLSHWNRYHVANCSLTTVIYNNGQFRLQAHNQTGHVPKEKFAALMEAARRRLGVQ